MSHALAAATARLFFGVSAASKVSVLGAITIIALLAFVWAMFIRRPEGHSHHRHHWLESKDPEDEPRSHHRGWFSFRRHHRRHHRERPANPTLAQTRGLPSVRQDESQPPTDSI